MSKYKEFQEYVDKVLKNIKDYVESDSDDPWSCAQITTICNMDDVLESYIIRDKPKDCAKKILGEVNE